MQQLMECRDALNRASIAIEELSVFSLTLFTETIKNLVLFQIYPFYLFSYIEKFKRYYIKAITKRV